MESYNDNEDAPDLSRGIADALGRLETSIGDALEAADTTLDAESAMEGLEGCAAELCRNLSFLDTELERVGQDSTADLNQITASILTKHIEASSTPVVVRSEFADGIPCIGASGQALSSTVDRILSLAFGFADLGSEIYVSSSGTDAGVTLQVGVHRDLPLEVDKDPRMQFESAIDFADNLGGALAVDIDLEGRQLSIELSFDTAAIE